MVLAHIRAPKTSPEPNGRGFVVCGPEPTTTLTLPAPTGEQLQFTADETRRNQHVGHDPAREATWP